jgi:protein TonB
METPFTSSSTLSFDEIVFEQRNKNYGAFELRRSYEKHLNIAFLITFSAFVIVTSGVLIRSLFKTPTVAELTRDAANDVRQMKEIEIILPEKPKLPDGGEKAVIPPVGKSEVPEDLKPIKVEDKPIVEPKKDETKVDSIPAGYNSEGNGKKGDVLPTGGGGGKGPEIGSGNGGEEKKEPTFTDIPQVMPEFPGGEEALFKFLKRNLRFPRFEENNSSTVYVAFIIGADGQIGTISILKSGGISFDEEVTRVVSKMPKWKPGVENGENVAVRFKMPVKFRQAN